MENNFSSKALEVNLAETRDKTLEIPDEHKWFMDLSKSHWGIYKRTKEFIKELNHHYINYQYILDSLHNISLTDLWLYNSLEESERALMVLVNIFKKLINVNLEDNMKEQLLKIIVKFIDRLAKQGEFPPIIISECLNIIKDDLKNNEILYIRNSGYFKTYLNKIAQLDEYSEDVYILTKDVLKKSINYWEETSKIEEWFNTRKSLFQPNTEEKLGKLGKPFFNNLKNQLNESKSWDELTKTLFFNDIANNFRRFIDQFETTLEKIWYIFYLLHLPGMVQLRNHLLYDLNRLLRSVLKELDEKSIASFLDNIISLFTELRPQHLGTVLDCILTLGKEVINSGNKKITNFYINKLINFGFVHPGKVFITNDWQMKVNPNHVKNIRIWLELIEHSPEEMRELLSALIVNLKLGGIFISDTDLFQRDITKLLNSNISPVYKQMKQLTRIFPVYFREIGAEGKLREVTTAVDELSGRKDRLIHFLRKQIHTESNNTHIDLTRKIVQFWYDGNIEPLKPVVQKEVLESIELDNPWYTGVHSILVGLCNKKQLTVRELFEIDDNDIKESLEDLDCGNNRDKKRVHYMFKLYSLLIEKYSLESENIISMLKGYRFFNDNEIEKFEKHLNKGETKEALLEVYRFMDSLKKIILDPKKSEAVENIYYKRHIAIGIPSMYGQYMEPKFEALGLMFRLERIASRLMSKLIKSINLEYISAKTFKNILDVLNLFKVGLELDGIVNQGFNSNCEMFKYSLNSPSCSLDQYINIFQFMAQNIKKIIDEYFLSVYEQPLRIIISQLYFNKENVDKDNKENIIHMHSESFFREILTSAFLIQDLDNFITNIISTLRSMVDNYSTEIIKNMMTYDSDLIISPLYEETVEMDNPVFLGTKAYFLKKMTSYNFPVPPGFVLTTELFRHKDTIIQHPYMNQELDQLILKHINKLEKKTKKEFGNSQNPLLFSVRSGTAVSMPGAMRTFLNVGMNDEIAETLSYKDGFAWTSWDSYRRFIQSWGMAYGIDRDIFDNIIQEFKKRFGIEKKINFTPTQMKNIAFAYKMVLKDYNIQIESDPFKQLKETILNVIDSWSSTRVQYYRKHLQIADEWGTAVIVQKMSLGNLSESSGTGVVFTNDPNEDKSGVNLYGDFNLCSQGEDIVSGLVHTLPVSENQRKKFYSDSKISLQSDFPDIYNALTNLSMQLLYTYGFTHQEIEFTFESPDPKDLYILQTRNQKIKKKKKITTFVSDPDEMHLVGRGIGIGGGALSGTIIFDMEDLNKSKEKNPNEKHILVRPDTVPDDIPIIFSCEGLITGKGGATSHAAVTAGSLGKVCVVNCKGLLVNESEKKCTINGVPFYSGDKISIDGNLGNVYAGSYDIQDV